MWSFNGFNDQIVVEGGLDVMDLLGGGFQYFLF